MKNMKKVYATIQIIIVSLCLFIIWFEISHVKALTKNVKDDYPIDHQEIGETIDFEFAIPKLYVPDPEVVKVIKERNEDDAMPYILIEEPKPYKGSMKDIYIDLINEICENYWFVDDLPYLVQAIMEVESNYKPDVISSKDCVGLMQISRYWQADRIAKLRVTDIFDPYSNILVGVDLLEDLYYNYAHQDIWLAVMMYNMDFKVARQIRASGELTDYALKVKSIFEELKGGQNAQAKSSSSYNG